MEKILSLEYGVAGVCVLLTFLILVKIGEFLWSILKKNEELTDHTMKELIRAVQDNTKAAQHLDQRLSNLERTISDVPKLKIGIRRAYSAIREIAGDRWPKIRDEMLKDDFVL